MRNRDREAAARAAAAPQNLPAAIPQRLLTRKSPTQAPAPVLIPVPAAAALDQEARTTALARPKAVRTRADQESKAGSGI